MLSKLMRPEFDTYTYYFITETLKISQLVISMLTLVCFACILLGSFLFQVYFKDWEVRTLIVAGILTNF